MSKPILSLTSAFVLTTACYASVTERTGNQENQPTVSPAKTGGKT